MHCLQPAMTPKVKRGIVCLDAWMLCVHACVRGPQGPPMSQERALRRTWGEWGHVSGGGPAAWLEEADWARIWATTSRLGPREALCMCVSWVSCLFLRDGVSRLVCPNVSVSTFPCPRGNVCTPHPPVAPSARVSVCPRPRLHSPIHTSVSRDYPYVCLRV